MKFCEHTINEYKLNGRTLYGVVVVYKISSRSKELAAHVTVDLERRNAHVDSIGTERTDSKAEAERASRIVNLAISNVKKSLVDPFFCHIDYRK
jgi:hypothetical protein